MVGMDEKDKKIQELEDQLHIFREALLKIRSWELPKAYSWRDKKLVSYGYAFGSNGERRYIIALAIDALIKVDGAFEDGT